MLKNGYLSICVFTAFVLWYATFVLKPFNFWLMMSANTVILSALALASGEPAVKREDFTLRNLLIGFFSAAGLYLVFWIGRELMFILPGHEGQLHSIYANREILPKAAVAALLFFPIGFGEELFWRGFIQARLSRKHGKWVAAAATVVIYTAVHLPTGNPVLILAAAVCGAYWGALYLATGSLLPVLISHMLWDPFIFVIRPLM